MEIIEKCHPEKTLNQEQADLIQEQLVNTLDDAPSESSNPLQFTRKVFSGGVLWMTCHNEATRTFHVHGIFH